MPTRVDWTKIKGAFASETVILFMESRARHLLLSILDPLRWKATYSYDATALSDWDEIQRIVDDAEHELGVAMPVSSLVQYIDDLETLLQQILAAQCSCGSSLFRQQPAGILPNTSSTIQDGIGDPPATYGDEPITTWGEWEDYKCQAGFLFVEQVALKLEELDALLLEYTADGITSELVGWILSKLTFLNKYFALGWDIFTSWWNFVWTEVVGLQAAADEVRAAASTIACAIMNGDGPQDTADQFQSAVDDAITSVIISSMLDGFPWLQWANMIYTGQTELQDGTIVYFEDQLTPGEHTCCLPTPPAGASAYPVVINDITIATDPGHEGHYTINWMTIDGDNWQLNVNKTTTHGDYLYIDLHLAPSPYWGYPGIEHRGLVYRGITAGWPYTAASIVPDGTGYLQGGQKVGELTGSNWNEANLSFPYPNYGDDLATYLGISWTHPPTSTVPLNQNPDQERILRLKVLVAGNSGQPMAILFEGYQLFWALNLP